MILLMGSSLRRGGYRGTLDEFILAMVHDTIECVIHTININLGLWLMCRYIICISEYDYMTS